MTYSSTTPALFFRQELLDLNLLWSSAGPSEVGDSCEQLAPREKTSFLSDPDPTAKYLKQE